MGCTAGVRLGQPLQIWVGFDALMLKQNPGAKLGHLAGNGVCVC